MITYPLTAHGITSALQALGTTPNAVATNLSALGFRGKAGSECRCPVANYLVASIQYAYTASVFLDIGEAFATVWTPRGEDQMAIDADLPGPVVGFVAKFDKGQYPDLIEEESNA